MRGNATTAVLWVAVLGATTSSAGEIEFRKGIPADPKFFPIGVWLQSPRRAEEYRRIGINTYVALWKGPTAEQLDALDRAGMKVVCRQDERFLDRGSIIAWMHDDEPDNAQSLPDGKGYGPPIAPSKIVEGYRKLRMVDPDRPVFLNLGQGVANDRYVGRGVRTGHLEDYREYLEGCDIGSFDIYPVSHTDRAIRGNLWYVSKGVERLREWSGGRKPIWCCIETTGISDPTVRPTPSQVESEVWLALIHGAEGIIYFAHQFRPTFIEAGLLADSKITEAVRSVNERIRELAPVLRSPTIRGSITAVGSDPDVPVATMVKRHGGATYVFAITTRPGTTVVEFDSKSTASSIEVVGSKELPKIEKGRWTDRLSDQRVRIYRIVSGAEPR